MEVGVARDGIAGLGMARRGEFDLILLDIMLPGKDGLEICKILRRESKLPVILLSARTTEQDRIDGLDLGADDYIPKPFSPREVVSRVRAALRRVALDREPSAESLERAGLRIDPERRAVARGGVAVALTASEFDLLRLLADSPGKVWTRRQLVSAVLGAEGEVHERTIDAHVKNLRRKLEIDRGSPRYILTVHGIGYRFGGDGVV